MGQFVKFWQFVGMNPWGVCIHDCGRELQNYARYKVLESEIRPYI